MTLYLSCTHRWRPWHPRWHRLPLTHTDGTGVGVTWSGPWVR